ncbi:tetratricopeptide repeat protein [Opitutus sp. GAS368]|uniref:tetratricopeptide repeat protein n=1 Tax=Opitutus sp. GAS368 TaxID=1882749 RepID=UPI000879C100|nr:tetratricopeptide repeat protein [Opitutus sp. GAS368]SDS45115.1 Tetratricopeptide repeat-containing protein [Opitutus sp. GAS368]
MRKPGSLIRAALLSGLLGLLATAQEPKPGAPQDAAAAKAPASGEEIERLKARREQALKLNELIARANAALSAKQWPEAAEAFQSLITAEPERWEYRRGRADALLNSGKYEEAIRAYEDGLARVQPELTAANRGEPATERARAAGQMLTNQGNCYLKLGKPDDALAAYRKAAELEPNPSAAYFDLAATCYNLGRVDEALIYCDKTIAADPGRADAYFIKGSILLGNATMDQAGKLVGPPGMIESLQKYLELKPDGPHAADVKEMLKYAGVEPAPAKK